MIEGRMTRTLLNLSIIQFGALSSSWWDEINNSSQWQDGIFYFLCAAYALVSSVALVHLLLSLDLVLGRLELLLTVQLVFVCCILSRLFRSETDWTLHFETIFRRFFYYLTIPVLFFCIHNESDLNLVH